MKNPAKLFTIIIASCVFIAAAFTACDLFFDTESDSTTQSEVSVSFETTEGDTLSPDTETTLEETTEETTLDSTEESVETAKYKETINITETMETIKTDNGVVGDIDIGYRPLIEYDYTIQMLEIP